MAGFHWTTGAQRTKSKWGLRGCEVRPRMVSNVDIVDLKAAALYRAGDLLMGVVCIMFVQPELSFGVILLSYSVLPWREKLAATTQHFFAADFASSRSGPLSTPAES